jgi:hypothetical protein
MMHATHQKAMNIDRVNKSNTKASVASLLLPSFSVPIILTFNYFHLREKLAMWQKSFSAREVSA